MSNEDQLAKGKEAIVLEKKILRSHGKEYLAELRGLDNSGLEGKLLGLANHNQEIITTKNGDEELEDAKNRHNNLAGVYKDQLAGNKILSRFIHLILKEAQGETEFSETSKTDDTGISLSVN